MALPQGGPALPPGGATFQRRCLCCDDEVGEGGSEQCAALQLLETLGDEMDENDKTIDDEFDGGGDPDIGGLHRTARYFMYRAFVAAQYGHLGKGNRVRIPACVVAAIRARYRAPGCDCAVRDLAACQAHVCVGHKDQ